MLMIKFGKYLLFVFLFNIIGVLSAKSAVLTATSCSEVDIQAAIDAAHDSDMVTIPAGNCTWTTLMTINKAIILQGSGIGNTVIRDGITGSGKLLQWTLVTNKISRMTGIEFEDGGRTILATNGVIGIDGSNVVDGRTMRIDHNKFDHLNGNNLVPKNMIGVIDNNIFLNQSNRIPIYAYGKYDDYGDSDWIAPTSWGGSNFLFVEDNSFTCDVGCYYTALDGKRGARVVWRHNIMVRHMLTYHGTESGGFPRGGRAMEVYGNSFDGGGASTGWLLDLRSGSVLFYNNTATNYLTTPVITLINHRNFYNFPPWGSADGTNPWDLNVPGGPFESGMATGGGSLSMTDSSKSWTSDQWVGYQLKKTGCTAYCGSEISSNTSTTITLRDNGGYATNISFSSGEGYEIYRVLEAIDQPCRGGGSIVTRDGSENPIVPPGWNDQYDSPCYEWNNLYNGSTNINFNAAARTIRQNEHYFNDTQAPGYSAYTYPHPLRNVPSNPTNLRLTQ